MIWAFILLLACAALAPLALVLRRQTVIKGGRDPAIALHRDQLAELDRDLAEGRILPAEHATARLEVQRRLLQIAGTTEASARPGSRTPVFAVLALVPVLALGLYVIGGSPGVPTATSTEGRAVEEDMLVGQLRERLAAMDPHGDQARQGYMLLGNVEESRGNYAAAAAAWRTALQVRFDAALAARTAEAATRAEGGVSDSSAALYRRALAAAPPDAPWRGEVEQRLAERRLP
jgi:cytochrome c-type biogenesis protein CcmH